MYDIIGNIAVLDEHTLRPSVVAKALLSQKNIHAVFLRTGEHKGRYRVTTLRFLGGNHETRTIHKEQGIIMHVDVAEAYFSPRLGTERLRIAHQIRKGERVLVLFAGIAPYALVISKHSKAKNVCAIEWNPRACDLARQNIRINSCNNVFLVQGNVRTKTAEQGRFDRVIMMHPSGAGRYLQEALGACKRTCMLHYYAFANAAAIERMGRGLVSRIVKTGKKATVIHAQKTAQVGVRKYRMCYDVLVTD